LLVPVLRAAHRTGSLTDVAATAASLAVIAVLASKHGGARYYFLPLVGVALWQASTALGSCTSDRRRRWCAIEVYAAAGITFGLIAAPSIEAIVTMVHQTTASSLYREVRQFSEEHDASRMALGYGSTAEPSYALPEIVFRGGRLPVDTLTVFLTDSVGMKASKTAIAALQSCRIETWLLPRGETPFSVANIHNIASLKVAGRSTFDEDFRAAFTESYIRVGMATAHLDAWRCRGVGP
jgi:hypothetical protein